MILGFILLFLIELLRGVTKMALCMNALTSWRLILTLPFFLSLLPKTGRDNIGMEIQCSYQLL